MVARHDTSATSDRNDAYGNQRAVYGGTYLVPPRYLDKYVGDDGTPDTYRFLSALPGRAASPHGPDRGLDARRRRRPRRRPSRSSRRRASIHRDGAVYHLTGQPGAGPFASVESYDPKTGTGTIVVWSAPGTAVPAPGANAATRVLPVGLTATALYDVAVSTSLSAARAPQVLPTDTGANLMSGGITLGIAPADGAAFVTLTKR